MPQNFNLENMMNENLPVKKDDTPIVEKTQCNETIEEYRVLDQHLGNPDIMEQEAFDGNYVGTKNHSVQITQLNQKFEMLEAEKD